MSNEFNPQDPKAFVDNVFAKETERQETKAQNRMDLPIDLAAGGLFNMDQLTYFHVPEKDQSSYTRRIERSLEDIANLERHEAEALNNVFLNIERLLVELVKKYYDAEQVKLLTGGNKLLADDIAQITWMFQERLFELFDNKEKKWDMFDYMIFLPGWRQHNAALKLKSPDGRVPLEKGIISYLVSDMMQTYYNALSESLRTEMLLLSQFMYQFALLADNAAEVFTVLYDQYNPTN